MADSAAAQPVAQIEPGELKQRLDAGDDIFILDVRNEDEFANWRIEARRPVRHVNIPYFDILEDEDGKLALLPEAREYTVVCAKGGASDYIAELLAQRGKRARNVAGGMLAWSALYGTHAVGRTDRVEVRQVNRYSKGCLSYVLVSGNEAIVVDPARHVQQYLDMAARDGFRIVASIDTHLHADHISGGRALSAATGSPYYLPPTDAGDVTYHYRSFVDGLAIPFGQAKVEAVAVHTPGHTPGSTCVLVDGKFLLTGDTLFIDSIGRPDLGGQAEAWIHNLYATIVKGLDRFGDDLVVLPTHYAGVGEINENGFVAATLGEVRRRNTALHVKERDAFVQMVMDGMGPQPNSFQEIRKLNKGLIAPDEADQTEMEIGPNRCAATAR